MMRQTVGMGLERCVAERALPRHHGDGIGRARRLRGKQRRQGRSGGGERCIIVRFAKRPFAGQRIARQSDVARRRMRQRMWQLTRQIVGRVVPEPQDGVALGRRKDVDRSERASRIGHRALQETQQALAQRNDAGFVKEVACVFQHPLDAIGRAVGTAPLAQRN